MASDKLTQKALEQHDKIHPKLQSTKIRSGSQSKDDGGTRGRQRKASRSDANINHQQTADNQPQQQTLERQGSRASLGTSKSRGGAGMTVFRVVAAARAWKRWSQKRRPSPEKVKVQLENTYRVEPEPEQVFKPEKVKIVIEGILQMFLKNFKYTQESSKSMSLTLSNEIKYQVKKMDFPRYKIICNVILMQNAGQGSQISSRCIWNPSTDSYASCTYKTSQAVCIANVHAVYFD